MLLASKTRVTITFTCSLPARLLCLGLHVPVTNGPWGAWLYTGYTFESHKPRAQDKVKCSINAIHYQSDDFTRSKVWFWHLLFGAQPWVVWGLVWEGRGSRSFGPGISRPPSALCSWGTSGPGFTWHHHCPCCLADSLRKQPLWLMPVRNKPLFYLSSPHPPDLVVVLWFPLQISKRQRHLFPSPWCQLHNFILHKPMKGTCETSGMLWHLGLWWSLWCACWLSLESPGQDFWRCMHRTVTHIMSESSVSSMPVPFMIQLHKRHCYLIYSP